MRLPASTTNGCYDELCALLEFAMKVSRVFGQGRSSSLEPTGRTSNRDREIKEKQTVADSLAEELGIDIDGLKSADIHLDMESPLPLVQLRDALTAIDALKIDPLDQFEDTSNQYWQQRCL